MRKRSLKSGAILMTALTVGTTSLGVVNETINPVTVNASTKKVKSRVKENTAGKEIPASAYEIDFQFGGQNTQIDPKFDESSKYIKLNQSKLKFKIKDKNAIKPGDFITLNSPINLSPEGNPPAGISKVGKEANDNIYGNFGMDNLTDDHWSKQDPTNVLNTFNYKFYFGDNIPDEIIINTRLNDSLSSNGFNKDNVTLKANIKNVNGDIISSNDVTLSSMFKKGLHYQGVRPDVKEVPADKKDLILLEHDSFYFNFPDAPESDLPLSVLPDAVKKAPTEMKTTLSLPSFKVNGDTWIKDKMKKGTTFEFKVDDAFKLKADYFGKDLKVGDVHDLTYDPKDNKSRLPFELVEGYPYEFNQHGFVKDPHKPVNFKVVEVTDSGFKIETLDDMSIAYVLTHFNTTVTKKDGGPVLSEDFLEITESTDERPYVPHPYKYRIPYKTSVKNTATGLDKNFDDNFTFAARNKLEFEKPTTTTTVATTINSTTVTTNPTTNTTVTTVNTTTTGASTTAVTTANTTKTSTSVSATTSVTTSPNTTATTANTTTTGSRTTAVTTVVNNPTTVNNTSATAGNTTSNPATNVTTTVTSNPTTVTAGTTTNKPATAVTSSNNNTTVTTKVSPADNTPNDVTVDGKTYVKVPTGDQSIVYQLKDNPNVKVTLRDEKGNWTDLLTKDPNTVALTQQYNNEKDPKKLLEIEDDLVKAALQTPTTNINPAGSTNNTGNNSPVTNTNSTGSTSNTGNTSPATGTNPTGNMNNTGNTLPVTGTNPTGNTNNTGNTSPVTNTNPTGSTNNTGNTSPVTNINPTGSTNNTGNTSPVTNANPTGNTNNTGNTSAGNANNTGNTSPATGTNSTGSTNNTGNTSPVTNTNPTGNTNNPGNNSPVTNTNPTGNTNNAGNNSPVTNANPTGSTNNTGNTSPAVGTNPTGNLNNGGNTSPVANANPTGSTNNTANISPASNLNTTGNANNTGLTPTELSPNYSPVKGEPNELTFNTPKGRITLKGGDGNWNDQVIANPTAKTLAGQYDNTNDPGLKNDLINRMLNVLTGSGSSNNTVTVNGKTYVRANGPGLVFVSQDNPALSVTLKDAKGVWSSNLDKTLTSKYDNLLKQDKTPANLNELELLEDNLLEQGLTKPLPKTGDANSLIGLIGTGLASVIGLVSFKRKK